MQSLTTMPSPTTLGGTLPPLYARWAAELLGGPIPEETKATCQDCAMLCSKGGEQARPSNFFFNPTTKCCTYVPILHNFLVGAILLDDDSAFARGRATVEERLRGGIAVTPLGMGQPPPYSLLYEHGWMAFGRSRTMRCPHYLEEGGICGVWKHRESTCATWFCKHVRGAVGREFWRECMHTLLSTVERSLAAWCVLKLDVGTQVLRRIFAPAYGGDADSLKSEHLDGRPDPVEYREIWGKWEKREQEFYRECARLVAPLAWPEILGISGPEVEALAQLTKDAYARLVSQELPERFQPGSFQLVQIGHETTRVSSYSQLDPLDIPNPVLKVLHYFDGRPTREALQAIAATESIRLEENLVRKLVDFGILKPAEPEVRTAG